jgi:hypothetical protein
MQINLPSSNSPFSKHVVAILVILVFSLLLARSLTPFGSATTPDSINYLDIAKNIKSGRGVLVTDHSLENYDGLLYQDLKLWPPLYPLVLAATSFKLPSALTASHLSAALLALTAVFAYLLLAPVINWYLALPASLLLCLTGPLITVYTYAWSETLFIPLLLAAAWAAIRYLETAAAVAGRKYLYLYLGLLVVLLLALAYTRYIGIALVLLLPATYLWSDREHRPVAAFIVAACVYAAGVGYLLAGNYLATGSITGGTRLPSDRTFLQALHDVFLVVDANIPSSILVLLLVLATAVSVALACAVLATGRGHEQPVSHRHTRNILLLVVAGYSAAIVALRMYSSFDPLDERLLAPALTVLWVLLLVVLVQLKPLNKRCLIAQVLLWCCVIMFPVKGYMRFQESMQSWRQLGSPNLAANSDINYSNYTNSEQAIRIREMFSELAADDTVVVTDRPLIFEFVSGIRSLQLPEAIDLDAIGKFNALPAGSLILLPNDTQQRGLLKLRLENDIIYEYLHLGQRIAIRTPIYVAPKDQPGRHLQDRH